MFIKVGLKHIITLVIWKVLKLYCQTFPNKKMFVAKFKLNKMSYTLFIQTKMYKGSYVFKMTKIL